MATGSYIGQVNIGKNTHAIGSTLFGVSNTIATEAAKVATLDGFGSLATGVTVHILFTAANTVPTGVTLKVGSTEPKPITNPNGSLLWNENSIISFTYDGTTNWVINSAQIDASKITIDASQLENLSLGNITNQGKLSGANSANVLLRTNGDSTIIAGPAIGSSTSTYLNNSGAWTTPPDTKYTLITAAADTATVAGAGTNGSTYLNLIENGAKKNSFKLTGTNITITSTAAGEIKFEGKAGTVTSITPGDGLVNGATTSTSTTAITESGTISIKKGGVTNDMLAGSIDITKLTASQITIGTQTKSLGEPFDAATIAADAGLSSALRYVGSVNSLPNATDTATYNAYKAGDVVTVDSKEYAYKKGDTAAASSWIELGDESSYKRKQTAVSSPTASTTTATAFIDTISQDVEGVITVTKKTVPVQSVAGLTGAIKASDLQTALSLSDYILKPSGIAAGDIIYYNGTTFTRLQIGTAGQVLKVNSGATAPYWTSDNSSDPTVTQNIVATTDTNDYPLLLSYYNKATNTTTKQTVNRVLAIYANKNGELHATSFYGSGANLTGITTSQISGTGTGTKYLRQDGWQTALVKITADNTNGTVVTGVGFNRGTFPTLSTDSGKAATFTVSGGVLTIVAGSDAALTTGTLPSLGTISKATLSIE